MYVPTSSYAEMGEWALPAGEGVVFHRVLRDAVARHEPDARWLRGGFWRNFQVKYREINDLHKQMLRTSAKVARMPAGADKAAAQDHLHRGQSNDCYWHGLFGGIYIPHMRMATLEHLIAAEDAADTALGSQSAAGLADLDMDGRDEAFLEAPGQVVTVKPAEGAGIASWDLRAARHGVASVMRRRPEAYHEALRAHDAKAAALAAEPGEGDGGATSIHDIVMTKEAHLSEYLHYDDHERRSALVRFLDPTATPEQYAVASEREVADFRDGEFAVDRLEQSLLSLSRAGNVLGQPVELTKTIRLSGGRMDPELTVELEVRHRGTQPVDARLGVELGVNLLGGGGNPDAWYEVDGARSRHDGAGTAEAMDAIRYGNDWAGVAITARAEPAADVWWSPIETVSNSESGFERVYQGSALLLSWLVRLEPGSVHRWSVCQSAAVARDKAAAERA
ncbi:MAG TPA: alpha-amylase/4-alpha-glucanotransferase domain-containing protein, partial [Candidatus Limnocylindrales bacterium]